MPALWGGWQSHVFYVARHARTSARQKHIVAAGSAARVPSNGIINRPSMSARRPRPPPEPPSPCHYSSPAVQVYSTNNR